MRKTTKAVVLSLLTIAMFVSLGLGATFALFTSESSVDIAVTSGKVDVKAQVESAAINSTLGEAQGSASVEGSTVALDKFMPGDYADIVVKVTNYSTVAVKWQLSISLAEGSDVALYNALKFEVATDFDLGELVALSSNRQETKWHSLAAAAAEGEEVATLNIKVSLPVEAEGAELMDKSCTIALTVKAVQGNAHTADPIVGASAFNITSAQDLALLRQNIAEGVEYTKIALLDNITLGADEKWATLDSAEHPFAGEFIGNTYTISYTAHTFDTQAALKGQKLFEGEADVHDVALRYAAVNEIGVLSKWDGESALSYVWQVNDLGGLKAFRDSVNSNDNSGTLWAKNQHPYVNETVEQTADIDLGGEPWVRIGVNGNYKRFAGTFNGNGYEFTNVVIGKASGDSVVEDTTFFVGDVFATLNNNNNSYLTNTITADAHLSYIVHNAGDLEQLYVWTDYTTATANKSSVARKWYINNVDGLRLFRDIVNYVAGYQFGTRSFTDDTVELTTDLDLHNEPWVVIGATFTGTFDSRDHEIRNVVTANSATDLTERYEYGRVFADYGSGAAVINCLVHNDGDFEEVSSYTKEAGAGMIAEHNWYIHNEDGFREFAAISGSQYSWNTAGRGDNHMRETFAPYYSAARGVYETHTINLVQDIHLTDYVYFNYYLDTYNYARRDYFRGVFDGNGHTVYYNDVADRAMEAGRLTAANALANSYPDYYTAKIVNLSVAIEGDLHSKIGEFVSHYDSEGNYSEPVWSIPDAEHFKNFHDIVNGGRTFVGETIKLARDIDLSAYPDWTPMGANVRNRAFAGTLDGMGHTISGISMKQPTDSITDFGAFFAAATDATIRNLKLDGTLKVTTAGAGFVGNCFGDVYIENCVNSLDIDASEATPKASGTFALNIGGIVCATSMMSGQGKVHISNCLNEGTITLPDLTQTEYAGQPIEYQVMVGGIMPMLILDTVAGWNCACTMDNLVNVGNIVSVTGAPVVNNAVAFGMGIYCGGLFGARISGDHTALHCYNLNGDYAIGGITTLIPQAVSLLNDTTLNIATESAALQDSYVGFDFDSVWTIDAEAGHAVLQMFAK